MSLTDDILKARKKRLEEEEKKKEKEISSSTLADDILKARQKRLEGEKKESSSSTLADDILKAREKRLSGNKSDDIAPVTPSKKEEAKEEEKPWYKNFFQSPSAFDDDKGNAFTDTMDTFSASVQDLSGNVLRGVANLGEGITDLLLHGVSGASKLVGADSFADDVKNLANKNTMNDFFDWAEGVTGAEKNSIFGETTDSVAQGVGQVAGIILTGGAAAGAGLGAGAVSALTTGMMGASSMGSGISEAYNDGATDGQAWTYGAIKGAVDTVSELVFGGLGKGVNALGFSKGLSSLDDMVAKKLSDKIGNIVVKNIVQGTVKASAEGFEELLAGLGTAAAKKFTYKNKEDWNKLIEDENLLEQFVVGALTSGITQGGDVIVANQTGTDLITGLNKNDQKVVDKLFEDRVAEAEKKANENGKTLSKKEKNQLYDEIINKMDRGELSLDTIEEVLGGDTFKKYKETVDSEAALKTEFEELGKKEKPTLADSKRYDQLEKQLEDIKNNSNSKALKAQLRNEVYEMTKGTRLGESYIENFNRKQAFTADLSKYKGKAQEFVKKVIESKRFTNSRRTHDFIDLLVNTSEDLDMPINLLTEEEIRDSGKLVDSSMTLKADGNTTKFAVDWFVKGTDVVVKVGDTVVNNYDVDYKNGTITFKDAPKGDITVEYKKAPNGWYDVNGEMTLNADSKAYLSFVAGHEITHRLEKAKHYAKLQEALFAHAKAKGVYDAKLAEVESLYKGSSEAEIKQELASNLVGEYIFSDYEFVQNLHAQNQSLFQQVWDTMKMATAGSDEARQLEKAQMLFENVYREGKKAPNKTGDTKLSMTREIVSETDNTYLEAVNRGDMETAQKMVDEVAISNGAIASDSGQAVHLYHGTPRFGFTKFNDGIIFATNDSSISAGYTQNKGWGRERKISEAYTEDDGSLEVLIKNAKNVLDLNIHKITPSEQREIRESTKAQSDELSVKIDDVWTSEALDAINPDERLDNDISWVLSLAGSINENIDDFGGYISANELENWLDHFDESIPRVREYFSEHRAELKGTPAWDMYRIVMGYDISDFAIDARYKLLRSLDESMMVSESGGLVSQESVRNNIEMLKDVGSYNLYGFAGGNPLVIDGKGSMWTDVPVEEWGGRYLTDEIGKRAKEEGYTAVIIKDIYDMSMNEYAVNKRSDVYIFFDSNQLKSADPITYDDDKNIIPLSERFKSDNKDIRYSMSSMANTFFGDPTMTSDEFSKRDYKETVGYKDYVDKCLKNMKQTRKDYNEDVARKEIEDSIDGIVQVAIAAKKAGYDIYDDSAKRDVKDSRKRLLFSSLEPNSDYFTSHDISAICDKRKNFEDIYNDIVRAEEAKGVPNDKRFFSNVDNYFVLHKLMADKGLTQPCKQCYVESLRKNLGPMAASFLELVQETNPNNTANAQLFDKGQQKKNNAKIRRLVLKELAKVDMTANDLTIEKLSTSDGLVELKLQAPNVYELFNSFYGQAKPKMPKQSVPFRFGELTALLTDENGKIKQNLVNKINSTGGFRLQSYSDFQIENFVDVLQVLYEAGTLGLNGHAYTKVPAFLEATEGTNLKRNISIFMYKDGDEWKIDKNDSFPYELEEIYKIVENDKSGNTGIIAVSQNADMSAWIIANDKVAYGIPFHKSGLKMDTVRDTDVTTDDGRVIKGYSETIDHTRYQSEVYASTGTKVKKGIDIYKFWDFDNKENLPKNELIEKNVSRYIDECEKKGYLPKFRDYVMDNAEFLNNVLKYSKELGFVSKDATIEDISFQYKGYTIPYGYYKFLGDFSMFTSDGKASPHDVLSLKNYDFGKAVEFFKDSEKLRRRELLQQFANGKERLKYARSGLSNDELAEIIKKKRQEIVNEIAPVNSLTYAHSEPTEGWAGDDIRYIAPVSKTETTVAKNAPVAPVMDDEPVAPIADAPIKTVDDRLTAKLTNSENELHSMQSLRESSKNLFDEQIAKLQSEYDSKKDKNTKVANNLLSRIEKLKRKKADADAEYAKKISDIESRISKTEAELQKDHTKQDEYERAVNRINRILDGDKKDLDAEFAPRREALADKDSYIANKAKELYNEISGLTKGVRASKQLGYLLDSGHSWGDIKKALVRVSQSPTEMIMGTGTVAEQMVREALNDSYENDMSSVESDYQNRLKELETKAETDRQNARLANTRKHLHQNIISNIKSYFSNKGYDFDQVLKKAKNLSTWATVDNTPSRVMKKSLGYKEGGLLADLTVNRVAQNETEGIKWLNTITDRKSGLLAQLSKQYNIKAGSKEIQAAQMYAEGFYVAENDEIYKYGNEELAKDFPDVNVQNNIKGLVNDPRIRQFYDDTLAMINESRERNGYAPIPRLDNYYLHYRAMGDTFSTLGLPFNPNDIRAKDLPTDLNGVTIDNKPGQPFFASGMHRTGKRTTFDLFDGIERYAVAAKNQIYHIDDIQTLRALRNYLADTFGQASGLEGLDEMSDAEAQERIKEVFGSHMSTFAKFLNEEANVLAGKTSLADRAVEGILGRRAITFLDTVNRQVGSNAVGYSVPSAIVNLDAIPRAFAKSNKADFVKAFAQWVSTKVSRKSDGFAENSPVIIRRKGADRFNRTLWQKMSDPGYVLMGAVDNVATELIARTKYNELTRKGMDSQQAHFETDKWVSDLMGDRSLGQMPQIFNSKMLGLFTKFQLEVRNNLDSMFYDTIQEKKASTEDIENELERNAETAAKATWTIFQLAVAQHVFGKAFESIAGYNPSFDIIDAIIKALGLDDDEESEDTALDNIEEAFLALLEDMPYASTFTGGRLPISNALPIKELVTGKDKYGSDKSRWETLGEIAPYYLMPGGYGQLKKTVQGLGMFSDDHPIAGSYTDSGDLRFPVDDNFASRLQAGLFGQWSSENAQQYLDEGRSPLNEKQIQELIDVGMDIQDYWKYRDGLKGLTKLSEKVDYIDSLDLTTEQKNVLVNNIADREEDIDMSDYGKYDDFEEFDFAVKNPEKYTVSKALGGYSKYKEYSSALNDITSDKDANGDTISGSRKQKVIDYINNLDADYYTKIILYRSQYKSDNYYNAEIVEYLNSRDDISYSEMVTILKELGFKISADGKNATWD